MISGFFRLKGRLERRTGYPIEKRWVYFKRRFSDVLHSIKGWYKLTLELEEVWLATRRRSPLEEKVVSEIIRLTQCAKEWRDLRTSELLHLYQKAAAALEKKNIYRFRIPSRFQIWVDKLNLFSLRLTSTREPLQRFWENVKVSCRRGDVLRINYIRVFLATIEEAVLFARFMLSILISGIFLRKH
ncbi:MAG: hypothetical protein ABH891_06425 [Candidatus Omnitrophota bacterium]